MAFLNDPELVDLNRQIESKKTEVDMLKMSVASEESMVSIMGRLYDDTKLNQLKAELREAQKYLGDLELQFIKLKKQLRS